MEITLLMKDGPEITDFVKNNCGMTCFARNGPGIIDFVKSTVVVMNLVKNGLGMSHFWGENWQYVDSLLSLILLYWCS